MNGLLAMLYISAGFLGMVLLLYLILCLIDYIALKIDNYNYNKERKKK